MQYNSMSVTANAENIPTRHQRTRSRTSAEDGLLSAAFGRRGLSGTPPTTSPRSRSRSKTRSASAGLRHRQFRPARPPRSASSSSSADSARGSQLDDVVQVDGGNTTTPLAAPGFGNEIDINASPELLDQNSAPSDTTLTLAFEQQMAAVRSTVGSRNISNSSLDEAIRSRTSNSSPTNRDNNGVLLTRASSYSPVSFGSGTVPKPTLAHSVSAAAHGGADAGKLTTHTPKIAVSAPNDLTPRVHPGADDRASATTLRVDTAVGNEKPKEGLSNDGSDAFEGPLLEDMLAMSPFSTLRADAPSASQYVSPTSSLSPSPPDSAVDEVARRLCSISLAASSSASSGPALVPRHSNVDSLSTSPSFYPSRDASLSIDDSSGSIIPESPEFDFSNDESRTSDDADDWAILQSAAAVLRASGNTSSTVNGGIRTATIAGGRADNQSTSTTLDVEFRSQPYDFGDLFAMGSPRSKSAPSSPSKSAMSTGFGFQGSHDGNRAPAAFAQRTGTNPIESNSSFVTEPSGAAGDQKLDDGQLGRPPTFAAAAARSELSGDRQPLGLPPRSRSAHEIDREHLPRLDEGSNLVPAPPSANAEVAVPRRHGPKRTRLGAGRLHNRDQVRSASSSSSGICVNADAHGEGSSRKSRTRRRRPLSGSAHRRRSSTKSARGASLAYLAGHRRHTRASSWTVGPNSSINVGGNRVALLSELQEAHAISSPPAASSERPGQSDTSDDDDRLQGDQRRRKKSLLNRSRTPAANGPQIRSPKSATF
eukprot:INCI1373.3.p1 GENE.INCI1373.3~~INCI1373.3.p1  ORF type:complete len:765 (+),score=111.21 INCI1373.3:360-2654(+)